MNLIQRRTEAEKSKDKNGKALHKLMNNARINAKLVNNEKDYLKCTSKPSDMLHKIFDNNLVAICKSRLA